MYDCMFIIQQLPQISELIAVCKRGDIQLVKSIIGEGISYNCMDEVNVHWYFFYICLLLHI